MWPALFITDISNDPASRAGDWQMGGRPLAPNAIFGSWKARRSHGRQHQESGGRHHHARRGSGEEQLEPRGRRSGAGGADERGLRRRGALERLADAGPLVPPAGARPRRRSEQGGRRFGRGLRPVLRRAAAADRTAARRRARAERAAASARRRSPSVAPAASRRAPARRGRCARTAAASRPTGERGLARSRASSVTSRLSPATAREHDAAGDEHEREARAGSVPGRRRSRSRRAPAASAAVLAPAAPPSRSVPVEPPPPIAPPCPSRRRRGRLPVAPPSPVAPRRARRTAACRPPPSYRRCLPCRSPPPCPSCRRCRRARRAARSRRAAAATAPPARRAARRRSRHAAARSRRAAVPADAGRTAAAARARHATARSGGSGRSACPDAPPVPVAAAGSARCAARSRSCRGCSRRATASIDPPAGKIDVGDRLPAVLLGARRAHAGDRDARGVRDLDGQLVAGLDRRDDAGGVQPHAIDHADRQLVHVRADDRKRRRSPGSDRSSRPADRRAGCARRRSRACSPGGTSTDRSRPAAGTRRASRLSAATICCVGLRLHVPVVVADAPLVRRRHVVVEVGRDSAGSRGCRARARSRCRRSATGCPARRPTCR